MLNKNIIRKNNKKSSNPPIFYGWIIVFICAVGNFYSGPGQTFSISIFIDSFIDYLGMSRALISSYYSMATLLAGILVLLISKQIDKIGHRNAITLISIFLGTICMFMSFIIHPFMLFIGFFLLRLFGQSSMTIGPSTLIPYWFETKRGRALSLMSMGQTIAAFLLPLMNIWLINSFGWRNAWRFWAANIWFVMVPLAWYFIRNKPSDIGLLIDGNISEPIYDYKSSFKKPVYSTKKVTSRTLKQASKTLSFWLLLLCVFAPSMISTGITFHIVSIFDSRGLSAQVAAAVLGIKAIISLFSALFAGYILDRFKLRIVIIFVYIFYFFVLIWLLNVYTLQTAIMYSFFAGIMMGFYQVIINIVWPVYFGLRHLASIRGAVQASMVIGSAFGPLPFGFAYQLFGGYKEIIIIMVLLSGIVALLTFFIPQHDEIK
jgi:MFS family permease